MGPNPAISDDIHQKPTPQTIVKGRDWRKVYTRKPHDKVRKRLLYTAFGLLAKRGVRQPA